MTFQQDILEAVLARSTSHTSSLHGFAHWERVRENDAVLASATSAADPEVVRLFALFHDSMRVNDGHDPDHGKRGSALARELAGLLPLEPWQLDRLIEACDGHTDGFVIQVDIFHVGASARSSSTSAKRMPSRRGIPSMVVADG